MPKGRVLLAMSGGVDSSVCARLLRDEGYEVVGVFMRTGAAVEAESCAIDAKPNRIRGCCGARDAADAQRVADLLDIPFHALDFSADFDRIKDYFADEYLAARTPNPCAVCNIWLKFGKLVEFADAVGAELIATGHYARIRRDDAGRAELLRGRDGHKDQTYFLFGLRREILDRVLFPIGEFEKPAVRALAEAHGLAVANKPDSQEVCFVPDGDHARFVRERRPAMSLAGAIADETGKVVGTHDGIARYTIGQRKGLGVALGSPRYVVELDAAANRVVIGPQELLRRAEFAADRVNWLIDPPDEPLRCEVKIRYLAPAAPATVLRLPGDRVQVAFDAPQSAIAPGQAAVFYAGEKTLGGGWIQ